eukprot:CAMPEP_0203675100 /NCGR_PEP_ID=MMETSP0090-20130426/18800_1 /ASSEMBLY_ACC=CAM_ASM_001088 /TAXON_ID=426623 /ORGANISM="Chaetoceros affinis, Strain CCMP159" /LENGTH=552 /DNA_ID=CAMNT_0050541175 /DNA_START=574 /DNA_END=2232 /DNA_ORIENTATION=-
MNGTSTTNSTSMSSIPSNSSFHSIPLQNLTTEGWLELFLTPGEKHTFSQWREHIQDKSITHRLTNRLMSHLTSYLPDHIAPNVITLTGFACLGQAWYVTNNYGTTWPVSCTWFSVINILVFYCTNCMDSIHATVLRQNSALGDLFKYTTDCNTTVFLIIVTAYCLGGLDNLVFQWYAVQTSQLVLFVKHLSAFQRNAGLRYNVLTGPGEVILAVIILLAVRATLGLDIFLSVYQNTVHRIVSKLEKAKFDVDFEPDHMIYDPEELSTEAMMMLYSMMYVTAVGKILMLEKKTHGWTRFGLCACLLMRLLPGLIIRVGTVTAATASNSSLDLTAMDVICDGFFMAVLTTDVTLAKMAGREIHPWVVLMSACAVLSHSTILTLVAVYYIAVFADLCSYLNMPLLTVCKNVYCDGVYDLCHIGHKTLFRNALHFGNRLYVGVVGDEDASSYKRPPIMTHDERCAEVEACKSVTKVIPNSPCFGLTEEFINTHQIHVVAYGEEYLERYPNPDDDPYYGYVRKIGIARPLPRHDGLSTSELIRRIQTSRPADERNDK